MDFAIYELLYSIVIDSFSGDLVWPRAVLVMEKTPFVRGAFVFVQGALAFLVYPLGSDAVLTHCNIVSVRLVDLTKGR